MIGSHMEGDLWIVPPPENSAWFSHLDWYLNWQMCKGQTHRAKSPDAELLRITKEYNLPFYDISSSSARPPLLISGQGLIPAKACLVMDIVGEIKNWLLECKAIACKMHASRVLIFLPSGAEKIRAAKIWDTLPGICSAEFVEDTADDSADDSMENA